MEVCFISIHYNKGTVVKNCKVKHDKWGLEKSAFNRNFRWTSPSKSSKIAIGLLTMGWKIQTASLCLCLQITVTCARSILTNQRLRFILYTMMMLRTASVAKPVWMCTSLQTGRLFLATGARWEWICYFVSRKLLVTYQTKENCVSEANVVRTLILALGLSFGCLCYKWPAREMCDSPFLNIHR